VRPARRHRSASTSSSSPLTAAGADAAPGCLAVAASARPIRADAGNGAVAHFLFLSLPLGLPFLARHDRCRQVTRSSSWAELSYSLSSYNYETQVVDHFFFQILLLSFLLQIDLEILILHVYVLVILLQIHEVGVVDQQTPSRLLLHLKV
jgi:hypothetical protein